MSKNVLTVDLGNSRAKFGLFECIDDHVRPLALSAVSPDPDHDLAAQLAVWVRPHSVEVCLAAGSNPSMLDRLIEGWPNDLPAATAIRSAQMVPVVLSVDQPDAVGLDRVLNAFAATRLHTGRNVIIVDSGTATTVDLVSAEGVFCGGTIFPGLRLSAHALHDYTAKLPMIDMDAPNSTAPKVPGRNTEAAIRAGLFWGQLGAIREIVSRLRQTCVDHPTVILTGGGSRLLRTHIDCVQTVDALALHGLAMLAEPA